MATEAQKPDPLALASMVALRVEIKGVQLVETLAKHPLGSIPSDVSVSHSAQTTLSGDASEILVVARFQLVSAQKSEEGQPPHAEPALLINATFALAYALKSAEGIQKQNLDAFGELNGIYNCWPYWREYVQQMTGRFGLPTLTLPVFQPTRRIQKKKQPKAVEAAPADEPVTADTQQATEAKESPEK